MVYLEVLHIDVRWQKKNNNNSECGGPTPDSWNFLQLAVFRGLVALDRAHDLKLHVALTAARPLIIIKLYLLTRALPTAVPFVSTRPFFSLAGGCLQVQGALR